MKKLIFLVIPVIIFHFIPLYCGELKLQLGTESGIMNSDESSARTVLRLLGRFNYQQPTSKGALSVKIRITPEGYYANQNRYILRHNADIAYNLPQSKSAWKFCLSAKNQVYALSSSDEFVQNVLITEGKYNKFLRENLTFCTGLSFVIRTMHSAPSQKLTAVQLTPGMEFGISKHSSFKTIIYLESFDIKGNERKNFGWRFGPQIIFQSKNISIFNICYQLIFTDNSQQKKIFPEQHIDVLWGRPFYKKWAVFFYINYYLLHEYDPDVLPEIVYTPINTQNWIYIQLGYDITRRIELYNRNGYFYEEVRYGAQKIEGWQTLLGFNISF
ncbi:MAG: hypothetical protein JXR46_05210 [Calditrichaceae bacterium]|nr:hypothetical protein [Calditrichaceae bacterium]MBN2708424.1 hypothetical protein [Calditrichaceae bacterium]RQV93144.1 MAG: hypothetical protein EH224_13185 [Calditrichota bacterium]